MTESAITAEPTFYGVSVGPGDPELATVKAIRVLEACPVIASVQTRGGATVALDIARAAANLDGKRELALRFAMSTDAHVLAERHRAAADAVVAELAAGRSVAMPVLGDASVYATYTYVRALVEAAGYRCETIPGVPSFCAIAAALGETLTPSMDAALHIVPAGFADLCAALDWPGTKVVMKAGKPFEEMRGLLHDRGLAGRASAVQNCSMPDELVARSIDDMPADRSYFTTVVVRP